MERQSAFPRARKDALIVKSLETETLVYDLNTSRAFCLNQSSALIWNLCDGETSLSEIARRAHEQLDLPIDVSFVSFALESLSKDGLLSSPYTASAELVGMTRLALMRRVGRVGVAAAVAVPLVSSVLAPTAAKAYGRGPSNGGGGWGGPPRRGRGH
jgi:Coenzyme PQQ synthesis protein D (PqqD)